MSEPEDLRARVFAAVKEADATACNCVDCMRKFLAVYRAALKDVMTRGAFTVTDGVVITFIPGSTMVELVAIAEKAQSL